MTMIRKLVRATVNVLGDDEVEVVMSTASLARDGHVLLPQGCRLDNYLANPIVLWSHDPDKPIGNAEDIAVEPEQIRARIKFAPVGISPKADEIRGLMKAGVVRAVSIGFDAMDGEPLDPRKPRGGMRFTDWELLELSAVSVPSDVGAVVTNRSHGEETMADTPNDSQAAAPTPAAPGTRAARAGHTRVALIGGTRGLYQVASLCSLFESLGWQVDMAKYEAAVEGDGSKVPGMLAGVLHDLGDALLAMTQEEIAEAIANYDVEPDVGEDENEDVVLIEAERQHIRAATNPRVRAFRRAVAHTKLRAGKKLSAATVKALQDARGMHEEGLEHSRSAMRSHKAAMAAVDDFLDEAGVANSEGDVTTKPQTSEGADVEKTERARSLSYRQRQADILALTSA